LRLRAARQRGAALNVVDLLIIGYLLEDRVVIDGVPTDYRSDMSWLVAEIALKWKHGCQGGARDWICGQIHSWTVPRGRAPCPDCCLKCGR
jgi:hypothetical protein